MSSPARGHSVLVAVFLGSLTSVLSLTTGCSTSFESTSFAPRALPMASVVFRKNDDWYRPNSNDEAYLRTSAVALLSSRGYTFDDDVRKANVIAVVEIRSTADSTSRPSLALLSLKDNPLRMKTAARIRAEKEYVLSPFWDHPSLHLADAYQ